MCGLRWHQDLFVEWAGSLCAGGVAQVLLLTFWCSPGCLAYFLVGGGALVFCLPGMGVLPRDLGVGVSHG